MTANASDGYGGGHLRQGGLTVTSRRSTTTAPSSGAGASPHCSRNRPTVIDTTTIAGNRAGSGGGISIVGRTLEVRDATIAANSASLGANLYAGSATLGVSDQSSVTAESGHPSCCLFGSTITSRRVEHRRGRLMRLLRAGRHLGRRSRAARPRGERRSNADGALAPGSPAVDAGRCRLRHGRSARRCPARSAAPATSARSRPAPTRSSPSPVRSTACSSRRDSR